MNAHARVMAVTVAPRVAPAMHFGAHPIATTQLIFLFSAAPLCFEGKRVHTVTASSHYLYTHAPEPLPSVWGQDRL